MANIATFSADFSQFDAALAAAREKLEGFAVTGRGVAASLERLARSFSGAPIIAEAQKVAAAVDAIGGASRLTEAEQRRVNATITEALAKYRALGQEAPAALQRLARETTAVGTGLSQIGTVAAGLVSGQAIIGFAQRAAGAMRDLTVGLVEAADRIEDLSVRTGIARTTLQQWRFAAEQTGTTLDAVIRGSEQLADRITAGGDDVARALGTLGLSLEEVRQRDPAQLMRTVAEALSQVESATTRTAIARDLLGRTGGELIPLLLDLERLSEEAASLGAVMSDDVVSASSEVADAWVALKAAGKGLVIDVLDPILPLVAQLATRWREAAAAQRDAGFSAIQASMLAGIPVVGQFGAGLGQLRDILTALGPLSRQVAPPSPLRQWREEIEGVAIHTPDANRSLQMLTEQLQSASREAKRAEQETRAWREALDGLVGRDRIAAANAMLEKLRAIGDPNLIAPARFAEIRDVMREAQETAIRLGEDVNREWQAWINRVGVLAFRLRTELQPALEAVAVAAPLLPSRALPGGGMTTLPNSPTGVAVPSGGTGGLLGFVTRIPQALQFGLGALGLLDVFGLGSAGVSRVAGGATTGFALGSMITSGFGALGVTLPALGPFGALAGAAIGLGRLLFGPDEETRIVNPRRDQFLAQFGGPGTGPGSGFHTLASILADVPITQGGGAGGGQLFQDLIRADTAKEYEAAVSRINDVLAQRNALLSEQAGLEAQLAELQQAQQPTWAEIARLAEQYGISLEGLGPTIQQLRQNDFASELTNALDRLIAAGGDLGGILVGMREELSQFVQDSLKFGTTVPENLRPYIEELARSGQLLDAQGQAITDLSGIQWGPPIKTQSEIVSEAMEQIIKRLEEIADLLAGRLPASAREGTEEVDRIIREYDPPEIVIPTRVDGPEPAAGFAQGSGGLRDFGRGTLAVLHGREAVLTESEYRALRRGGGERAITIEVPVILDGRQIARTTAQWSADLLPMYGIA